MRDSTKLANREACAHHKERKNDNLDMAAEVE